MPKKINSFHYDSLKIKGVYISNSIEKYKCFDKKDYIILILAFINDIIIIVV